MFKYSGFSFILQYQKGTIMESRINAMKWWNKLPKSKRQVLCEFEFGDRGFNSLTGREIEIIYNNELKSEEEYTSNKLVKVKAIITDTGDQSVGISPCYWEVECPFYKNEEEENKEFFRTSLVNLYKEFSEGRIKVEFDYEIKDFEDFISKLEEDCSKL